MFLIDDILLAPVKGIVFIARHVQEAVEKELGDESVIKRELLELQMRRELGEVPDEEFAARQSELFARLRRIKEAQREQLSQIYTGDASLIIEESGKGNP